MLLTEKRKRSTAGECDSRRAVCIVAGEGKQSAGASEPCDIEENEDAVCIV